MATEIFIYAKQSLPQPRDRLEEDLEQLLGGAGEVTGGGSSMGRPGWNVDLLLHDDADPEAWSDRLATFLRGWGVPPDTYFTVYPPDPEGGEGPKAKRVDVFGKPS